MSRPVSQKETAMAPKKAKMPSTMASAGETCADSAITTVTPMMATVVISMISR